MVIYSNYSSYDIDKKVKYEDILISEIENGYIEEEGIKITIVNDFHDKEITDEERKYEDLDICRVHLDKNQAKELMISLQKFLDKN